MKIVKKQKLMSTLKMLIFLCSLFSANAIYATTCNGNLLDNPDFEDSNTNYAPWIGSGGADISISNDAFSGNNALLISGSPYAKIEQEFPATAGEVFTLTAQVKATTSNSYLRLKFKDSAGSTIVSHANEILVTGQYDEYTLSVTAPGNVAFVTVSFLKVAQSGDVLVDDFCLNGDDSNPCNPDSTPPVISNCPIDIYITTNGGSAIATWSAPNVSDACDVSPTLVANIPSGSVFTEGTTTVTYIAEDLAGNTTTCAFNVIVSQSEPASCPNNTILNAGFESTNTTQIPNWYVVGDPDLATITNDSYTGSNAVQMSGTWYTKLQQDVLVAPGDELTFSAQVKATTNNYLVRLRFFNSNGNQISTFQGNEPATGEYVENTLSAIAPNNASYVSVVLVKLPNPGNVLADDFCLTISGDDPCTPDVEAPTITNCPEDIFISNYEPLSIANWPGPDVADNCDEFPSLTSNYTSGSQFPIGTTTVIYTATDAFGNESTCSFNIVVTQISPPGLCDNNLLNNPGFESNNTELTGWTNAGPANFNISNDAYADNNALQISGNPYGKIEQEIDAVAGVEYNLSAQIKANTNNFYLRMKFLNSSGQVITSYLSDQIVTGNYEEHSISGMAPAGTESILVSVLKTAEAGDVLIDEVCLNSGVELELPDLTISNVYFEGDLEIGRGGILEVEVMNTGNTIIDPFLFTLEVKLTSLTGGAPNWTIGLVELEQLASGTTVVEVPYYIQSNQGPSPGVYQLTPKIDAYDVIEEQNESNNSSLVNVSVSANNGPLNCATHTFDSPYFLHCTNYLPNGNLRIVNNTQSGFGLSHEVNADGEVIASSNIGPLPGGPNSEVYYNIASGVLTKFDPYGGVVWTKTIPTDILNAYNSFGKVIEFDGGIVFTGYVNEGSDFPAQDKGLLVIKTDIDLNLLTQAQFVTPGNLWAFVHDLEVVDAQRLAVVYNEGTNYQGSNKATLMILDDGLNVLSSNVISQRYGAVSVIPNINLLYTPCGYWSFRSYYGNAGGGGGFANNNSESLGAYEFQNNEMVRIKVLGSSFQSTGFGGTFFNTSSINFIGLASDGTKLTANESISYGNEGPPPYVPIHSNDTLWMEQEDNGGTILWSAFKTPYLQYQFDELVEIGGNHFLLTKGNGYSIIPVDCDESDPVIGEPNCEASSAFPWHEWISNVTAGGLNNDSDKSIYSDFTNLTPIAAEQGSGLNLSVTATYSYYTANEYISVWIDYNQNDIFEPSERVNNIISAPPNGNLATATTSFTFGIPLSSELGLTKMRIIMSRDPNAAPCGEIAFGEVEDYYVNITAGSADLNSSSTEVEYDLKVFPNPAGDEVTIDLGDFLSENVEIEIVNNLGTSLYRKAISEVSIVQHKVDLTNWKNGVYMVWVKPEEKRRRLAKLVVARVY